MDSHSEPQSQDALRRCWAWWRADMPVPRGLVVVTTIYFVIDLVRWLVSW